MSSAADVVVSPTEAPAPIFRFRIIPQLDTYPWAVRFAQTIPGKILLLVLAAAGFYACRGDWRVFTVILAATTLLPQYRRQIVMASTILYTVYLTWTSWFGSFAGQSNNGALMGTEGFAFTMFFVAVTFALAWMLFSLASKYRRSLLGKRPILVLLSGFFVFLVIASWLPMSNHLRDIVFLSLTVFGGYIWYIGYSLLDLKSQSPDPFWRQASTYRPMWSINATPYGKGAAYWRRIEAADAEQLAITQLKGLKLLAWTLLLRIMYGPLQYTLQGSLSIPSVPELLGRTRYNVPYHWYTGWESLVAAFLLDILTMSITGHFLISIFRLAGFRALRSTYRPLESRTVAEFWNRYYYYFKELLAEFFFYPTYMRYFKRWRRFRMVAATFAAAFLGNMIFHFTRDLMFVRTQGLWNALISFQVYAFYCLVLATAISISQLRHRQDHPPRGWLRDQLWPVFCVAGFYCVLHVFDTTDRSMGIGVYFRFLGHIFNMFT
ncbi:MAG: hypothetical protein ABSH39_00570 [Candidatus Acidiferrum sp.]|jgi:hypothetical protein